MGYYFLALLAILPFIQASKLLHGYPLYDPAKYQCKVVHGGWTEWSCFGPCSVSCGEGYQKRYRHCAAPVAKYGGNPCTGNHIEARKCDTKLKCPVDGGWSDHVKGKCSKSCGGGVVTFRRYCNSPKPAHCGKDCVGTHIRTEACNTHKCPVWNPWKCGKCKKVHGKCARECKRTCNYHDTTKQYCVGKDTEYRTCPAEQCKPDIPPRGACGNCHKQALLKASSDKYPDDFVGLACRAPELANFCKTQTQSKNGGLPANHWFWIHCSPDGPFCKPCATRNLVFNKKCDACEKTRDGPCTKRDDLSDEDMFSNEEIKLEDEDNW